MTYHNEHEPFAADWLRNLIEAGQLPDGRVDRRSITEVVPNDLTQFRECHFFAGIGGWPLALKWAGWPSEAPVWTGSCPCQPFSVAGKGRGESDDRHLWPVFRDLIDECRPPTIFGEQVASKLGRQWLARVRADLEALGYAVGAADLCAAGVGAPHIRQRLFWVAQSSVGGCEIGEISSRPRNEGERAIDQPRDSHRVADSQNGRSPRGNGTTGANGAETANSGGMGDAESVRRNEGGAESDWLDAASVGFVYCRDEKLRRVPLPESGICPLADGIPRDMGRRISGDKPVDRDTGRVIRLARRSRVGRLKGYGNAIVPQLAAIFIRSFLESMSQ